MTAPEAQKGGFMQNQNVIAFLNQVAEEQTAVFRDYQEAGLWKAAQASPTSAVSLMDISIVIFHQVYTVLLHQDLENPVTQEFVCWYLALQQRLIVQAAFERAFRCFPAGD